MIGINQQNMNEFNKYLLLKNIIIQEPISRIELSGLTGLSKMTITSLIKEYIESGIIKECGSADSTGGRKRTFLQAAPDALLTLGINISRNRLDVGIVNLKGHILQSEYMELSDQDGNYFLLNKIFFLCDRLLQSKYSKKIWGIGISCAGPLLAKDGMILNPPDFNNIQNLSITAYLQERYALPAFLQNDACTAALAEYYFGNANRYEDFIYVSISSGIGSGVIINGKLYTGCSGLAGIIGHFIVERDGLPCECGQKGCLEKYSSTRAAVKWAKDHGAPESLTWPGLLIGTLDNDPVCTMSMDRMIAYLETALANMANAFDTRCFIIGGDLYFQQETFVKKLSDRLQGRCFSWGPKRKISVEPSAVYGNVSLIGTAALVLENNIDALPAKKKGELCNENRN